MTTNSSGSPHDSTNAYSSAYTRFDFSPKIPGDNPTIGLLLCSDKGEAVAKYSILNENRQIFASKYLPNLPTEEQLRLEIEKERRLIESALEDGADE